MLELSGGRESLCGVAAVEGVTEAVSAEPGDVTNACSDAYSGNSKARFLIGGSETG